MKPMLVLSSYTAKLGDKEWLDSEQPGNSKLFLVTKLPVYFKNSEEPSKQFCDDQKVSYCQNYCTLQMCTGHYRVFAGFPCFGETL